MRHQGHRAVTRCRLPAPLTMPQARCFVEELLQRWKVRRRCCASYPCYCLHDCHLPHLQVASYTAPRCVWPHPCRREQPPCLLVRCRRQRGEARLVQLPQLGHPQDQHRRPAPCLPDCSTAGCSPAHHGCSTGGTRGREEDGSACGEGCTVSTHKLRGPKRRRMRQQTRQTARPGAETHRGASQLLGKCVRWALEGRAP